MSADSLTRESKNKLAKLPVSAVDRWKAYLDRMRSDGPSMKQLEELRVLRKEIAQEAAALAENFVQRKIAIDEFKAVFHKKSVSSWDTYGFKGPSGAKLLNVLVKHVPDHERLTEALRCVILAPVDIMAARESLSQYMKYLHGQVASKELSATMAGINRAPFFVSIWWYVQRPGQWPIFYPNTREVLRDEKLLEPSSGNAFEDYFQFCTVHNSLRAALNIDAFELEYLCIWLMRDTNSDVRNEVKAAKQRSA